MKLSFVVPCYNEEKNVALLLQSIQNIFGLSSQYEVIFVNDGSSDNTLGALKALCSQSKTAVKIIDFSRNFGKEAAMYAGLQHASGEYISIIDADLQQNPELVMDMLKILEEDPDTDSVCACQESRRENKLLSKMKSSFYKTATKFTDVEFVDGASDFRTFRKSVKDAVLSMGECHRFSKGIFGWVGFHTVYIPYQAAERANGSSKWSFPSLLKYGINGMIAFSTMPLKIAKYVGFAATGLSVIYALITLLRKLVSDISADGFTQLVILISFFGGMQLLFLGVIGEYLAKTYIETKNRPIYIAKQIIDNTQKGK